ncbi:hypothetical protein BANRA_00005 [Klebsiella pneumoniae]|nr:hypothetical protein BANRA_00005 [Klebsiella pneumoniae]
MCSTTRLLPNMPFTAFADDLHTTRWRDIEQESGLTRES